MSVWGQIGDWLGTGYYSEHALCLSNDPTLIVLFTASDGATWLSYFVIGGILLWNRKLNINLNGPALLIFGAFIFLCGLSHLCMVLTLFEGVYRLEVFVKALMAAVSVVAAAHVVLAFVDSKLSGS